MEKHKQEEEADLKEHPEPKDRDVYGGWSAGPKLEATGYFRAEKYNGKWWLVDPEGRLFWLTALIVLVTGMVSHR